MTVATALNLASFPEVEWIDDENPGGTFNEEMRVLLQTDAVVQGANQSFYNPIY